MSIDRKSNEYSNQEIIEKLRAIIDLEESKPLAERDVDLITECVDYLMELEQGVELTQEELEEEKQKIYAYNKNLNKPAKRLKFKGLLIAACFVVLMLIANFVAIACGVDTMSILKEWGYRIVEMFEGEQAEYKGITIIKGSNSKTYGTIDEFLTQEDYKILYPTKLPKNVEIIEVKICNSFNDDNSYSSEYNDIYYVTNLSNTSIIVSMNPNANKDFLTNPCYTNETINNYDCFLYQPSNTLQCFFIHESIVYNIQTTSYDNLITILNNLKER